MKILNALAATLVIIGALNWGLVALAEFDLVAEIFGLEFGETNAATRVVYGLVGLAGAYSIWALVCHAPGRSPSPGTRHRHLADASSHPTRKDKERVPNEEAPGSRRVVAIAIAALGPIASARTREQGTIVETAVAAGQFKTLAMLLKRAGLVATLQQAGPYTVLHRRTLPLRECRRRHWRHC